MLGNTSLSLRIYFAGTGDLLKGNQSLIKNSVLLSKPLKILSNQLVEHISTNYLKNEKYTTAEHVEKAISKDFDLDLYNKINYCVESTVISSELLSRITLLKNQLKESQENLPEKLKDFDNRRDSQAYESKIKKLQQMKKKIKNIEKEQIQQITLNIEEINLINDILNGNQSLKYQLQKVIQGTTIKFLSEESKENKENKENKQEGVFLTAKVLSRKEKIKISGKIEIDDTEVEINKTIGIDIRLGPSYQNPGEDISSDEIDNNNVFEKLIFSKIRESLQKELELSYKQTEKDLNIGKANIKKDDFENIFAEAFLSNNKGETSFPRYIDSLCNKLSKQKQQGLEQEIKNNGGIYPESLYRLEFKEDNKQDKNQQNNEDKEVKEDKSDKNDWCYHGTMYYGPVMNPKESIYNPLNPGLWAFSAVNVAENIALKELKNTIREWLSKNEGSTFHLSLDGQSRGAAAAFYLAKKLKDVFTKEELARIKVTINVLDTVPGNAGFTDIPRKKNGSTMSNLIADLSDCDYIEAVNIRVDCNRKDSGFMNKFYQTHVPLFHPNTKVNIAVEPTTHYGHLTEVLTSIALELANQRPDPVIFEKLQKTPRSCQTGGTFGVIDILANDENNNVFINSSDYVLFLEWEKIQDNEEKTRLISARLQKLYNPTQEKNYVEGVKKMGENMQTYFTRYLEARNKDGAWYPRFLLGSRDLYRYPQRSMVNQIAVDPLDPTAIKPIYQRIMLFLDLVKFQMHQDDSKQNIASLQEELKKIAQQEDSSAYQLLNKIQQYYKGNIKTLDKDSQEAFSYILNDKDQLFKVQRIMRNYQIVQYINSEASTVNFLQKILTPERLKEKDITAAINNRLKDGKSTAVNDFLKEISKKEETNIVEEETNIVEEETNIIEKLKKQISEFFKPEKDQEDNKEKRNDMPSANAKQNLTLTFMQWFKTNPIKFLRFSLEYVPQLRKLQVGDRDLVTIKDLLEHINNRPTILTVTIEKLASYFSKPDNNFAKAVKKFQNEISNKSQTYFDASKFHEDLERNQRIKQVAEWYAVINREMAKVTRDYKVINTIHVNMQALKDPNNNNFLNIQQADSINDRSTTLRSRMFDKYEKTIQADNKSKVLKQNFDPRLEVDLTAIFCLKDKDRKNVEIKYVPDTLLLGHELIRITESINLRLLEYWEIYHEKREEIGANEEKIFGFFTRQYHGQSGHTKAKETVEKWLCTMQNKITGILVKTLLSSESDKKKLELFSKEMEKLQDQIIKEHKAKSVFHRQNSFFNVLTFWKNETQNTLNNLFSNNNNVIDSLLKKPQFFETKIIDNLRADYKTDGLSRIHTRLDNN